METIIHKQTKTKTKTNKQKKKKERIMETMKIKLLFGVMHKDVLGIKLKEFFKWRILASERSLSYLN